MLSSSEIRRFASAVVSLQSDIRDARHDIALLERLALGLGRLGAEVVAAYERAFSLAAAEAA
jgi:hypothetical protein